MNVGNSVRLAIRDFQDGELESSMLHACNAVDGTASKIHPKLGSTTRFKKLLRESYDILGPMGFPGIDLSKTRFDVAVKGSSAQGVGVDIADVLWGVHRCTHGHGDELPNGFELVTNTSEDVFSINFRAGGGILQLNDRIIFGMLAVAVLAPVNHDQHVPDGCVLPYFHYDIPINQAWGERDNFLHALPEMFPLPSITLNLAGPYADDVEHEVTTKEKKPGSEAGPSPVIQQAPK